MKWGDAKEQMADAQRDGVKTLGGLRAWFARKQEPELPETDEAIEEILDWFEGRH